MADSSSTVPSRIEVIKAGTWPQDSNKGALEITVDDLHQFKANFDRGVGIPHGLNQLPIDYMHNDWDKAAGWITQLEVVDNTLMADVEWTPTGRQALQDGDFKCFSPSFWPRCLGTWHDPEDYSIQAQNVLVGAGLTNIPFFKGLKPIMASNGGSADPKNKNVIYVSASVKEKPHMPTLEELLDKYKDTDASEVTADDRKVLDERKGELTADQLAKFYPEEKPVAASNNESDGVVLAAAERQILADIKNGTKKLVEASAYDALTARVDAMSKTIEDGRKREAEAFVKAHVERGAIKSEQYNDTVARVLADESFKKFVEAMPGSDLLKEKISADKTPEPNEQSATEQIRAAANEMVAAAAKDGRTLSLGDAISTVRKNDTKLAEASDAEVSGN